MIAWQKPNLLLLDEPTNHLDLEMRQALTMALQNFDGAMVVVSHDRHLLRNTVDEFWLVSDGAVAPYEGDLEDYERWLADRRRDDEEPPRRDSQATVASQATGLTAEQRKAQKREQAELRKQLSPWKKQLAQAEKAMEAAQAKLAELEEALSDASLYEAASKDRLKALLADQASVRATLEEAEATWLETGEKLEELEAQLET